MTDLTNGPDFFDGTEDDDVVNGLGGDDEIHGNGGDDILSGGGDADLLFGGDNDDTLNGGSGSDTLDGGTGDDTFTGGSGDDTVVIHVDAANGIGSQNGGQLTLTTADGVDLISSGVEHIQFDDVTIDVVAGDAIAHLGIDSASIDEQTGASGNVLDNDVDIDDAITLTDIDSDNTSTDGTLGVNLVGEFGELTLEANGDFDYTAYGGTNSLAAGESVNDVFTYTLTSGGVTSTQTLTITINGVNDDPNITSAEDSITYNDTTGADSFLNTNGTLTAADVDATDVLAFGVNFGDTIGTTDNSIVGFDTSVEGDFGTLYINSSSGAFRYRADDDAMEAAKTTTHNVFTFTLDDGNGGTDSQTYDVTINGVNDRPDLAPISGITYDDTAADDNFPDSTGTLAGSDRDNDAITYKLAGAANDHSVSGYTRSLAGTYGTLYLNHHSGAYLYVPDDAAIQGLGTSDTDVFTLRVSDGDLLSTQSLTVTLNGVNDAPDMSSSTGGNLVEAGGVANGTAGTDTSFMTVDISDRDTGDTPTFDGSALLSNGWTTGDAGVTYTYTGVYGTATLTVATGNVGYQLDNNDGDTQALNVGDQVQDNFTAYGTDGTATDSVNFVFTIDGANDNAVIAGDLTGDATEAGGVANGTAGSGDSGTATATDVDNDDNVFNAVVLGSTVNGYGSFTLDASGNWTFTVDEDNATVQALNVGNSTTNSFAIFSEDFTQQTVNITIHGANDAAVVGGDTTGSVTESGGPLSPGDPTATGTLTSADVDNNDNEFDNVNSPHDTDGNLGTYTIDAAGNWTFNLKNGKQVVQALNDGDSIQETFTVETIDGTAQVVTVTIDGQNKVFEGTSNDDIMSGTDWGDTFSGFDGNDIYDVNNAADKVIEAFDEGQDLVRSRVSYTLDDNVEDLTLTAHAAIDGTGNGLENVIIGNDRKNVIDGEGSDDTLRGGDGNDVMDGGDGDDIINGQGDTDTVSYASASAGVTVSLADTSFQNTGGAGTDKITNVENLTGSDHDDTLTGNALKNVIIGGLGQDELTGGAGNDTFRFNSASETTNADPDTITDLTNNDRIDLSAIDPLFTVVGSFSGAGHELTLSYNGIDDVTTLLGDIDGDTVADLTILITGDHTDFDNFI